MFCMLPQQNQNCSQNSDFQYENKNKNKNIFINQVILESNNIYTQFSLSVKAKQIDSSWFPGHIYVDPEFKSPVWASETKM